MNAGQLQQKLVELKLKFKQSLPDRLTQIQQLWERVLADASADADLNELLRVVHSLVGAGGTYGADAISKTARVAENTLRPLVDQASIQLDAHTQSQINHLVLKLAEEIDDWHPELDHNEFIEAESGFAIQSLTLFVPKDCKDYEEFSREIHLKHLRLNYVHQDPLSVPEDLLNSNSIVIVDDAVLADKNKSEHLLDYLSQLKQKCPNLIVLSDSQDLALRLAVVRAEINEFFLKPVNNTRLLKVVERLIEEQVEQIYHVLIVDDDQDLAQYYHAVMQSNQIRSTLVSDPLNAFEVLQQTHVDLILLDISMPNCNGFEVARMIRQDERLAEVPIIFHSVERVPEKQITALNVGADDFIEKPCNIEYLIKSIKARIRRADSVRRLHRELEIAFAEIGRRDYAMNKHSIVSVADTAGNIIYANDKFVSISGYAYEELIGNNHRLVKSGVHDRSFYENMWTTISQGETWQGIICNRAKSGECYWVESTIVPFIDGDGLPYQYVSVRTDITAFILSQQNLKLAKHQAENANKAKSEFLSRMSHELRTPLNAILGFSQLLGLDEENPISQNQRDSVGEIVNAGSHLLSLINDVLDLSKIEAGYVHVNLQPINATQVLKECVATVQTQAAQQSINIEYVQIDDAATVMADRVRLKQVLLNLLSNAIKYNKPHGKIMLTVRNSSDTQVDMLVADTGIGIAEDKQKEMFQSFHRLGAEHSDIEGTGIGLVITKNIVELMNAKLSFDSKLGEGTCFTVSLPCAKRQASII
ncbi:MAG: response regulator [Gammaproteobacteria bacterium]|nr:response regulator [Gammaproteobacteria bacterium]